jgi:AhpD family alkylhydroperoxidase
MSPFQIHTPATAPAESKAVLEGVRKAWGVIPNLHGLLAEAPSALEGHNALFDLFAQTSFNPVEQQVVLLSVSYANSCEYCMAGHTLLAKKVGAGPQLIEALRSGSPIADGKLEALHRFTTQVVESRGHPGDDALEAFLRAGYTQRQVLEVVLGVALKTIANYANEIARTPLDAFHKGHEWKRPARKAA